VHVAGQRILALDLGQRRIGLAVSDAMGWSAQGLPTLERRDRAADLAALAGLAREHAVGTWLLGLPRRLSGAEGPEAVRTRAFGAELQRHTRLPVVYWDERLTTVEAARVLREAGSSRQQERRAVDRLAAVLLLQSYLDYAALRQKELREEE
jgi:putative Holliday junction resolvase